MTSTMILSLSRSRAKKQHGQIWTSKISFLLLEKRFILIMLVMDIFLMPLSTLFVLYIQLTISFLIGRKRTVNFEISAWDVI